MSERRKKRKRTISSSSSLITEQPDSPRSELSISSQVTEDESSSEDPLDTFLDALFQCESTAARVAPYHGKTPSGSLGGTESTSSSVDSVACDTPKFIPPSYPSWPGHGPWPGYDPWRSPLASYPLQKKQSSPRCSVRPLVSLKSEPSFDEVFGFNPQKTQSAPLRETDSTASSVSMKSESSMYEPPSFNLQKKQSEPLCETDSTVSNVSMKSDSSMFEPPSFKLKKKQSSTADYPCKKCGRRSRGRQKDTEDDNKNLNLPSAPQPAPEDTTKPVRREKRDQVLQSVLLEKTIKKVEMETEKLELEKRKLALEIQILEQKGKYTI